MTCWEASTAGCTGPGGAAHNGGAVAEEELVAVEDGGGGNRRRRPRCRDIERPADPDLRGVRGIYSKMKRENNRRGISMRRCDKIIASSPLWININNL